MPRVNSVKISLFGGIFEQEIWFQEGLNILSGVNGTGKTTALSVIKNGIADPNVVKTFDGTPQVAVYNPKRNSERKSVEAALQYVRQQNRTKSTSLQEAVQKALSGYDIASYDSLGSLFVYDFEERSRSGVKPAKDIMLEINNEYNEVLKQIFPDYKLIAEWNPSSGTSGAPDLKLITRYNVPIDLNNMSTGESEVLALIFNIYFNKSGVDLYLIDEPEVHLNWTLERGLFNFLNKFASDYEKQIIVTTHSRVIFNENYKPLCQFLVVKNNKIFVEANPPKEYLEEIAGETAAIIQSTAPSKKTFFVEDEFHKDMITGLLNLYSKEAEIVIVKDASGAIRNLYNVLKSNKDINNSWFNAYLMIDGDGENEIYKTEPRFVHLRRYCAECYFFDIEALSLTLGFTTKKTKSTILKNIKNENNFEGKHKELLKQVVKSIKATDINLKLISSFDASTMLQEIIKASNLSRKDFIQTYLLNLKSKKNTRIFDTKLISAIKN